jgi:hypothetical protein
MNFLDLYDGENSCYGLVVHGVYVVWQVATNVSKNILLPPSE